MIITILSVAILIIGIGSLVFYKLTNEYYEWPIFIFVPFIIIGIILTSICFIGIIDAQANKDIIYQNTVEKRNVIEYRLEKQQNCHDTNILINGGVYDDALEYNKELRDVKKWAKNPWFNWLIVQELADLDYIEIDKGAQ